MSRVLAYTSPARGHLYPLVPVLLELRRRGYRVTLRTLASQVPLMRELGFDAQPVSSAVAGVELDDYKVRLKPAKGRRALETFVARAPHDAVDLQTAIEEERPDALLVDCNSWGAGAVAQAAGRPWAQYQPYPLPVPSRELPPFFLGLAPATGRLGRARDALLRPLAALALDRLALGRLNRQRAELGLPALRTASEQFLLAPLVLHMTAAPLEYPRSDWPEQVRMIGPCAWEPPGEPPAWLEGIERPLLLVSTSSERQADRRLVTTAFEAFADDQVELVATLPAEDLEGIQAPANAHLERFLPHGPLLARAACAITHGGAGITQKALAAGVPVCAVPFGRDQHEVARRVELAGAGTCLPARSLTGARLRRSVAAATAMRAGAERIMRAFAAAGNGRAAVDAFERAIGQGARG